MDTSAIIFDIERSDDIEWLKLLRDEVADSDCYSEADKIEVAEAVRVRCSFLNARAMSSAKASEDSQS